VGILGCGGGGSEADPISGPDAGPDLLPAAPEGPEDCGRFARMVVGMTRTWVGRFGQSQFVTTTSIESFDEDGLITESLLSGDPQDFHGEGVNHYQCDAEGLHTADTSFQWLGPDGTVYFYQQFEYDPPILRAKRNLALGDTWQEDLTRYSYTSQGDDIQDLSMEYRVTAEQIVSTGAGSWPALLVEGWDLLGDQIAERDWRVDGVGDVMFATYQNGMPGFAQELQAIELSE
jgi:hypothetical protein